MNTHVSPATVSSARRLSTLMSATLLATHLNIDPFPLLPPSSAATINLRILVETTPLSLLIMTKFESLVIIVPLPVSQVMEGVGVAWAEQLISISSLTIANTSSGLTVMLGAAVRVCVYVCMCEHSSTLSTAGQPYLHVCTTLITLY